MPPESDLARQAGDHAVPLKSCQGTVERLVSEDQLGGEIDQRAVQADGPTVTAGGEREVMQDALARRADIALLQTGADRMNLMGEQRHEALGVVGIAAQECPEGALGIGAHARVRHGDRIAVISPREQRRLREELAGARGVQHNGMPVDGVPDQAELARLHLEDRRGWIALVKQRRARSHLTQRRIPVAASREKIHSRDRNLWHISHEGGELEDAGNAPLATLVTVTVTSATTALEGSVMVPRISPLCLPWATARFGRMHMPSVFR